MESGDSSSVNKKRTSPRRRPQNCDLQCPYKVIRKLVELLKHPLTQDQHDRQLDLLLEFFRASEEGIWMVVIPFIIEAIELLADKQKMVAEFREPFIQLLELTSIPPMLRKPSEIIEYMRDLEEYFSTIGRLFLYIADEDIQLILINSLSSVLRRERKFPICCVSKIKVSEAIENSQLPEILSQFLILANENIYQKLLELFIMVAEISQKACQKMVLQDAIQYLLMRLDPNWRQRLQVQRQPLLPTYECEILHYRETSKIIWLLISAVHNCSKAYKKSLGHLGELPLWSLLYALRVTLMKYNTKSHERNDLVAILIKLVQIFPNVEFVKTGLAEDLAQLSVSTEITPSFQWIADTRLTQKNNDYVLKKLLLSFLPSFLTLCPNTQILRECHVVKGLLNIITGKTSVNWLQEQHCNLILISFNIVRILIEALPEDFAKINGPCILLKFLNKFRSEMYDASIFIAATQLLKQCILNTDLKKIVLSNDGTQILLVLLEHMLTHKLTVHIQKALAYIFCILEELFEDKTKADMKVVDINLQFIKRIANLTVPTDSYIQLQFVLCTLNFLWESIVWCDANLEQFIKQGGVYILLDIAETKSIPIGMMALGCLTDICEVKMSIPYFITWQGKRNHKILTLLLNIFRRACKYLDAEVDNSGFILNHQYPIMGKLQRSVFSRITPNSSPAICDLMYSARPKCYAIFQLLFFHYKDTTETANEFYRICSEDLSLKHKTTLLVLENFFALKLGEVWKENELDLRFSGIEPIPVDKQLISILTERIDNWGLHIQSKQSDLRATEKEQAEAEEKLFYHKLKEPCLSAAIDAFREMELVARCTERMFRVKRKFLQYCKIERQLAYDDIPLHRTYQYNLDVTPVFNQIISLESNLNVKNEKIQVIRPVSPDDYEDDRLDDPGDEDHLSTPGNECYTCLR